MVGEIRLQTTYGQDPSDGHWGCPLRERWGLSNYQQLSLALEDKLAFTLTTTTSYEEAAATADKWGSPISPSTLHSLAQRLGSQAEEQTQARLQAAPPKETQPQRAPSQLGVLMLDGWIVRQRGAGWGRKKTKQNRVEWHEWKTGTYYQIEQASRSEKGRGQLLQKSLVGWQGKPDEFGQRLHHEALRAGLGRARQSLVVADGAPWIWKLAQERWPQAEQVLDFYHATEHLWELSRQQWACQTPQVESWVDEQRHRLRHGQEEQVLQEIAGLKNPRGLRGQAVKREAAYFQNHRERMNYAAHHERGHPIGSGTVESSCRQRQCRFKRPGQFWTPKGMRNLGSLCEARHNRHWDELWLQT